MHPRAVGYDVSGIVKRWSREGQEMVRGSREGERLLEVGQRGVDLQGLGDRGRTLVADLIVIETATTGKRAQCQMSVKNSQEMVSGWESERLLKIGQRAR